MTFENFYRVEYSKKHQFYLLTLLYCCCHCCCIYIYINKQTNQLSINKIVTECERVRASLSEFELTCPSASECGRV